MELKNFLEIEKYAHTFLGRIALEEGVITIENLLEAIKIQHRNPDFQIGQILLKEKNVTGYQLQHLLELQEKIHNEDESLPMLCNSIIRGIVHFENLNIGIDKIDLQKAEQTLQQAILFNKEIPYLQDLLQQMSIIGIEKSQEIYEQIEKLFGQCPRCKRNFHLYCVSYEAKLYCPSCWDTELIIGATKELPLPPISFRKENIDKEQRLALYRSPKFLTIYKTLKNLQPRKKEEIVINVSESGSTIVQIFNKMTVEYSQEQIDSIEVPIEELVKEEEKEEKEEVKKLVKEEKEKPLKTAIKFKETITLGWDLARVRMAFKQNWISSKEIIYAFYCSLCMEKERKSIIQILQQQKNFSTEQRKLLNDIKNMPVAKIAFHMAPLEDKIYQYLLRYELLFSAELKKIMEIQLKLNIAGIRVSLSEVLLASRVLSSEMVEAITKRCEQELKQKHELKKSISTKVKRKKKPQIVSQRVANRSFPIALLFSALFVFSLLLWSAQYFSFSLKTTIKISSNKVSVPKKKSKVLKKHPRKFKREQQKKQKQISKNLLLQKMPVTWFAYFDEGKKAILIEVEQQNPGKGSIYIKNNSFAKELLLGADKIYSFSLALPTGNYQLTLTIPKQGFKESISLKIPLSQEEVMLNDLKKKIPTLFSHIEQLKQNTQMFIKKPGAINYQEEQEEWLVQWQSLFSFTMRNIYESNKRILTYTLKLKQLNQKIHAVVPALILYFKNNKKLKGATFEEILISSKNVENYQQIHSLQQFLGKN